MKKQVKAVFAAIFIGTFVVGALSGCQSASSGQTAQEEDITIAEGDVYQFNDAQDGEVDLSWEFETGDASVAEVRAGKYIMAYSTGETDVTVNKGDDGTVVYHVTVEDDDETRLLKGAPDIKDATVYLGAGYNAFTADEYITVDDISLTNTVIKVQTISDYFAKDNRLIYQDTDREERFIQISGESTAAYADSYEKSISGSLSIDVKGIIGGNAAGKYVDKSSNDSNTKHVFNTLFAYNKRIAFMLMADNDTLTKMAKENSSVWKKLTGTDQRKTTVEEFFNTYGTHIVTRVNLGGRLEFDYTLSSSDSNITSDNLLDISGKITADISAVKVNGEGKYSDENIKSAKEQNLTIKTTVKTYGGKADVDSLITDVSNFAPGYTSWYSSIAEDNYAFIGVSNGGLIPVWELLPDEEEYAARREEFINYYNNKIAELAAAADAENEAASAASETTAAK